MELNYVVWVDGTEAVFGPFANETAAKLWAMNGTGDLAWKILKYVDLVHKENPETPRDVIRGTDKLK